jgi:hypothetical protein
MGKDRNYEIFRQFAASVAADQLDRYLQKPLIIVSSPRSGSTLLFQTLLISPDAYSIGNESHILFGSIPSLRAENKELDSGRLTAMHATPEIVHLVRSGFLLMLANRHGMRLLDMQPQQRPRRPTLLEKTPRNALNIPFLLKVFPDARFVFLHRDPRQNINSIIEAWETGLRTGRFVTFRDLPGWDREVWCLLLPSGWRSMRGKSLAQIAAFQWQAANNTILNDLETLPSDRWITVRYSELVNDTAGTIRRCCDFAGLEVDSLLEPRRFRFRIQR